MYGKTHRIHKCTRTYTFIKMRVIFISAFGISFFLPQYSTCILKCRLIMRLCALICETEIARQRGRIWGGGESSGRALGCVNLHISLLSPLSAPTRMPTHHPIPSTHKYCTQYSEGLSYICQPLHYHPIWE